MLEWTRFRDDCTKKYSNVEVRIIDHDGHQWVEMSANIGPSSNFDRYAILLHNFDLTIGQISEIDGELVLWQTLPLDGARLENLEDAADAIATQAVEARDFFGAKP